MPGALLGFDRHDTAAVLMNVQNENPGAGQVPRLRFRRIIGPDVDLSASDEFFINQEWLSRLG